MPQITHNPDDEVGRQVPTRDRILDDSTKQEATAATEAELSLGLSKSLKLYRKACLWSIFFSTCVVMEGFDMLLLNSLYAYPPFQRQFGVRLADGSYELSAAWQSGLSIGAFGGQIIGLFINGIIADRFGYRKTLIGALVSCCAFIFIIFFSETTVQLLIGEMLIGIPWGVFQTITITYASEVCPTHLRAYLTTYVNICWVIGQFIAAGVLRAMLTRDDQWGYKIPFALQWMWPIPLMIVIWLAPESPWWLVRRDRNDDAKKSLARLTTRNSDVPFQPEETISMMIYTNEVEKETEAGTSYLELLKSVNLRRMEIVCVTWMIQTFSGNTFSSYSTYFYEQAGLASESSFSMTLGQYGLGAVGTIVSWFLMRQFGRRTLYFSGQVAMCVLLFIVGCTSFAGRGNAAAQWTSGSMMLLYTFVYNCTVGPLCYSLVSELPSTRLRIKSTVHSAF